MKSKVDMISRIRYLILVSLMLSVRISLDAQSSNPFLVNINTPSATEMAHYQRVPVSYNNGLPNIEIPLYTVKSHGVTLPISLTYHASGVRINQYPSYVGLAWNLNVGGAITRVINGDYDEKTSQDMLDESGISYDFSPGHYFSSRRFQVDNWANDSTLFTSGLFDYEPDEFIVNACGLNASIFFYRDAQGRLCHRIQSHNGILFKVEDPIIFLGNAIPGLLDPNVTVKSDSTEIRLQPSVNFYGSNIHSLISEFTLVKNDGTRLVFGGKDCIECVSLVKTKPQLLGNQRGSYLKTIPTAWMLREIIAPTGQRIQISYERDGTPVVVNDTRIDTFFDSDNSFGIVTPSREWRGMSCHILHPLYPKEIRTDDGLRLLFETSQICDNTTTQSNDDYNYLYESGLHENEDCSYNRGHDSSKNLYHSNYYKKLDRIYVSSQTETTPIIRFNYIENPSERLKLDTLVIEGNHNGRTRDVYSFSYHRDLLLPAYHSTHEDNWGYYTDTNHRNLADSFKDSLHYAGDSLYIFNLRHPSLRYCRQESLMGITYPTGGSLSIEYELNDYSKIANQSPYFNCVESEGLAGGLRVKRLAYTTGEKSVVHSFRYINEDGSSSGILSGIPCYYNEGEVIQNIHKSGWSGLVHYSIRENITHRFKLFTESPINPMSLTNGNHVTYSRVVEDIGTDVPLTKVYEYTDMNDYPDEQTFDRYYTNMVNTNYVERNRGFTSSGFLRGHLKREAWLNGDSVVRDISFDYLDTRDETEEYLKCADNLQIGGEQTIFMRLTPYKRYTFYPSLIRMTEKEYNTDGHVLTDSIYRSFTYNQQLLLAQEHWTSSKDEDLITKYSYVSDQKTGSGNYVFSKMTAKGMTGMPVETIRQRNGKVISGERISYQEKRGFMVPSQKLRLNLDVPINMVDSADSHYEIEEELLDVDINGNPVLVKDSEGMMHTYKWDVDGNHPIFHVTNAKSCDAVYSTSPVASSAEVRLSPDNIPGNMRTLHFDTYRNDDVTIALYSPLGYNWYASGTLDGTNHFQLVQIHGGGNTNIEPWIRRISAYEYRITFHNISPGHHILSVQATDVMGNGYGDKSDATLRVSYTGYHSELVTPAIKEWYFEDFESYSGRFTPGFGCNSSNGYMGELHFKIDGDPDRIFVLEYDCYRDGSWTHVSKSDAGTDITIFERNAVIDNVCLYPVDSEMSMYTWYPQMGMRSMRDSHGRFSSYEYDSMGRLQAERDENGSIVHYYRQSYALSSSDNETMLYDNDEITGTFTNSSCNSSIGEFSSPVEWTVSSGQCHSSISKEDANRKAFDKLVLEGQWYADTHSECKNSVRLDIYNPNPVSYRLMVNNLSNPHLFTEYLIPAADLENEELLPTVEVFLERGVYSMIYIVDDSGQEISFLTYSGMDNMFGFNYSSENYPELWDEFMIFPEPM